MQLIASMCLVHSPAKPSAAPLFLLQRWTRADGTIHVEREASTDKLNKTISSTKADVFSCSWAQNSTQTPSARPFESQAAICITSFPIKVGQHLQKCYSTSIGNHVMQRAFWFFAGVRVLQVWGSWLEVNLRCVVGSFSRKYDAVQPQV